MWKRLIVAGIVIVALVGGLAYFQFSLKPRLIRQAVSNAPQPPIAVTTEPARSDSWISRRSSIGSTVATQGIDVMPQVAGIITKISADNGEQVKQGAPLFELDTSVERADLSSAKATLKAAETAFARAKDLAAKSAGTVATLDQARAARDTASEAVRRVQALIDQKIIAAPFSGRLGIRKVSLGQYVSPGTALISLQQIDPMQVDFPMPERSIGKLAIGQHVTVRVDTWPGEEFDGRVTALESRVAADTRTLDVRASIANPNSKLLPGMFANVTVRLGDPRPVITVARTAITYTLYGDSVYVVRQPESQPRAQAGSVTVQAGREASAATSPGKNPTLSVERRFVKTGEARDDRVAIVSGLSAGEQVVTTGGLKLKPDARVRIANGDRLKAPAEMPRE